jgi:hypothetical protein
MACLEGIELSGQPGMEVCSDWKEKMGAGGIVQRLKPNCYVAWIGMTEVMPCYKAIQGFAIFTAGGAWSVVPHQ